MSETITIPKQEYATLIRYKKIIELESSLEFDEKFLKRVDKARKDLKEGKGVKLNSKKEVEEYFKAM